MALAQFINEAKAAADRYNIPQGLFLGLVQQESGYNPYAVSSAGAYGLSQLMPGTARDLGVNMYDPIANLQGGAKYLRQQYDKYGTWEDALGAYNAGPGNWDRVKAGTMSIPDETANYIPSVVANATDKFGWTPAANSNQATLPVIGSTGGPQLTSAPLKITVDGGTPVSPDDDGNATTRLLNRIFGPSPFATDAVDETGKPIPNTDNPNAGAGLANIFTAEFWQGALIDIVAVLAIIALVLFGVWRVVKSQS